jgi:EmrB/QacA subfamily drug resistance transporter
MATHEMSTTTSTPPRIAQSTNDPLEVQPHRWWILIALAISAMMAGLDSSVSNAVLPVIRGALQTDAASVQWVVLIYLLAFSSVLLSAGRLGDIRGHRGVYLAGFAIFVSSSAVCTFAPGLHWLVFARVCQGTGAALLVANAPAILTSVFPEHQRGRALGLQTTALSVGLAIGPSLGGWLTNSFGWSAVFLINVPVGLAGILLAYRYVPGVSRRPAGLEGFDVPGAATFTAGIALLILGINQAHAWGGTSPPLLASLITGAGCLAAFVWIELHTPSPLLDLKLLDSRVFSTSVSSTTLYSGAVFAMTSVLPFYLLQARMLSPVEAGMVLSTIPILMPVIAPLSGRLSDHVGWRLPVAVGSLLTTGGLLALSTSEPQTPLVRIIGSLMVVGVGAGLYASPNFSAALGAAPRERRGVASGLFATARGLGMVLGFAVGGAILTIVLERSDFTQQLPIATAHAASAALVIAALLAHLAGACAVLGENRTDALLPWRAICTCWLLMWGKPVPVMGVHDVGTDPKMASREGSSEPSVIPP